MNLLTLLGPTAAGKTRLAALVASKINGEIISADSRQVYRNMNIGTGKDYSDYIVDGKQIPVHLVDIVNAGTEYNVFQYQKDFIDVFRDILQRGKFPLLCGGSGLYLESVLKGYKLINVPIDSELRIKLEQKSLGELTDILSQMKVLHNITDIINKKRAVRAIEIELWYRDHPEKLLEYPDIHPLLIGLRFERDETRKRITERLKKRLDEGMKDEVRKLMDDGLTKEKLIYYGLEYKYLALYLTKEIGYNEMFEKLNIAIHQFSKRQMTWFRGMERKGSVIHWIDGTLTDEEKISAVLNWINKS